MALFGTNEILLYQRFLKRHVLLAGMWFCKSDKPPMNLFLLPIIEELNKLYNIGKYIYNDETLF